MKENYQITSLTCGINLIRENKLAKHNKKNTYTKKYTERYTREGEGEGRRAEGREGERAQCHWRFGRGERSMCTYGGVTLYS